MNQIKLQGHINDDIQMIISIPSLNIMSPPKFKMEIVMTTNLPNENVWFCRTTDFSLHLRKAVSSEKNIRWNKYVNMNLIKNKMYISLIKCLWQINN